jgi:radical SAM superfamily enzyme YgiQ (UPF0313 family)
MRLVFVDNLVMPETNNLGLLDVHPHLGLISLAAVARRDGHEVKIYDPKWRIQSGQLAYDNSLYERVALDLLEEKPGAIGFTTLGCSIVFALNLAAKVKACEPEIPILFGGPHATMLHREIMERFRQVDVIVRYEAEETLLDVLLNLDRRNFKGIPGITWRGNRDSKVFESQGSPKIENLDTLPIPSYELYPVEELNLDIMRVEAGRGCPYSCTFCSTAMFFQRSFRLKSAPRLVKELDLLHDRYGVTKFKLDHDLFTVNRRKVLEFCEEVRDRGYKWRVSARVDCVDNELLVKMGEAGCVGLYFGLETGSRRMQKLVKKRLDLDLVRPTLDMAEDLGIETTVSLITGYPEERQRDQDDTLDLLGDCFQRPHQYCIPQLHILCPEPGTPLFQQHAHTLCYDGYMTNYNAWLLEDSDLDLILNNHDIFSSYYYYPATLPRFHYRFAVDVVDIFRKIGRAILDYILRYFEGRLSGFIEAMRDWAINTQRQACIDGDFIFDFSAYRFGASHHVTSLLRYSLTCSLGQAVCEEKMSVRIPLSSFDRNQAYQLGDFTFLLEDIHDCGNLLDRIRELPWDTPPIDDLEAGGCGNYLVIIVQGVATSYRIDPGIGVLLGLFKAPRTCRDVVEALSELIEGYSIGDAVFESLVGIGALVPTDTVQYKERTIA